MQFSIILLAVVAGIVRAESLTVASPTTPTIDHRMFKRDPYVSVDEDAPAFEKRAASCTFPRYVTLLEYNEIYS